jgi:hypothetical protein
MMGIFQRISYGIPENLIIIISLTGGITSEQYHGFIDFPG